MKADYESYVNYMQRLADLRNAAALLSWDQETYMPAKGAHGRSRQLATLATTAHELFTQDAFFDLVNTLATADLSPVKKKNIEFTKKELLKERKFTVDFVRRVSETVSKSFVDWNRARNLNDFNVFKPSLQELVDLKKEESEILGYTDHPYDPLLDNFEPGLSVKQLDPLFSELRSALGPLLETVKSKSQVDNSFLFEHYDTEEQWRFGLTVLKNLGFDFESGRQDKSVHPFTTNFSSQDVRITTRLSENDLSEMLWSTIHEGGHALYEQGLPYSDYGLPSGQYLSLSIHESQSRLYENNVGRSMEFWTYHYPILTTHFEKLKNVPAAYFFKAMNRVEPSLIRTNADELTYHFHIIIRYEIERGLLDGSLNVSDLREIWNDRYDSYLGLRPEKDTDGVLQDIHWSHGSFGYFPTYSLGSLYAAQFMAQIRKDIPGLDEQLAAGIYDNLLSWLRRHIHVYGKQFTADELCNRITGNSLSIQPFMEYATQKYAHVYNF